MGLGARALLSLVSHADPCKEQGVWSVSILALVIVESIYSGAHP